MKLHDEKRNKQEQISTGKSSALKLKLTRLLHMSEIAKLVTWILNIHISPSDHFKIQTVKVNKC